MSYALGNPYSLLLAFTGAFSFAFAAFLWRHRSERGVWPLAGILVGAGVWAVSDALRIAAPTGEAILFWNKVAYVGSVVIAPSALLFAAAYADRDEWFRPTRVGALLAISALTYLVVVTNPIHGLWRTTLSVSPGTAPPVLVERFEPLHLAWVAYVLFFVVPVSVWLILTEDGRDPVSGLFRGRTVLVLVAFAVPAVCSAAYVLGLVPIDPTPFGFLLTGAAFAVGVLRYRLLNLVPIARATVLDDMDSGVLVVDRDGAIVDANPPALEILNRDEDAVVGTSFRSLLDGLSFDTERFLDVRDTEETVGVEGDGETRHYDVSISPIRSDGQYLGRVAMFADVTERERRRAQLAERTRELERRNERLDEFASLVSHDLRNPLSVVASSIELARARGDVAELDRAEDALDRMDDLIEDMLVLSRTGSGLDGASTVDVGRAARRTWSRLDPDGADVDVRDGTPTVEADETQVEHLLGNLFRNAVDHNDPPVTVTVGPLANGETGFYVADDGAGIAPDRRDEVFEHGHTTSDEGTGFGLSIVEHVAAAHGWDPRIVESDDGGARFEFRPARDGHGQSPTGAHSD